MNQNSEYKMIPEEDQLSQISRDLKFYPCGNDIPNQLTTAQIDSFNQQGFIRPITIFAEQEMAKICEYFTQLLNQTLAAGNDSYSISSAHLKHGKVYDLLTQERIVALISDLLGENVIGWGSHFFCKMPGDGKAVAWHQDASYWPLTPSKAVTVWLAIDDTDLENGCMKFIAGSHKFGHMTYRPSDSTEHNVLNQTIENPEQYGQVVDNPLQAGQISIHSDLLLHGSEANNSNRRRCGLTLRYCSADVRASLDWNQKGVFVCGLDSSGHWSNRVRPQMD